MQNVGFPDHLQVLYCNAGHDKKANLYGEIENLFSTTNLGTLNRVQMPRIIVFHHPVLLARRQSQLLQLFCTAVQENILTAKLMFI